MLGLRIEAALDSLEGVETLERPREVGMNAGQSNWEGVAAADKHQAVDHSEAAVADIVVVVVRTGVGLDNEEVVPEDPGDTVVQDSE